LLSLLQELLKTLPLAADQTPIWVESSVIVLSGQSSLLRAVVFSRIGVAPENLFLKSQLKRDKAAAAKKIALAPAEPVGLIVVFVIQKQAGANTKKIADLFV
jgi:hypothetical protein